jgi:uncharacterized phage protein (predicted DNA packaging)
MAAIVTLEEMKAWLKVQYDEEDALIESLILKAQAAAEDFCRTEFGEDNAPEPVRQAIVLLVSYYFQNRDVTDKQVWLANRMAFENLLYPYRDVSKMF